MLITRFTRLCAPADDEAAVAAMDAALEEHAKGGTPASSADAKGSEGSGSESKAGETASSDRSDDAAGAQAGGDGKGDSTADEQAAAAAEAENDKGANLDPEADRGDGRNAAGRFVKKEGETDEELAARRAADPEDGKKAAAAKPADAANGKPKAGAKKPDHLNDPIPDEIKGRTRERIESLVKTAKELATERDTLKAEVTSARELVDMIEATGAKPEIFAQHMNILALMHSHDPADKQAVLTYLRKAVEIVGAELGETPAGKSALDDHQDLLDEVEAGELKRERATEIAEQRNRIKASERLRAEQANRSNDERTARANAEKITKELNALSDELRARDGAAIYGRKHVLLIPMIKRLKSTVPPDELVAAVRESYEALKLGPGAPNGAAVGDEGRQNRAPAGTGNQQPLRGKQGAGAGTVKEPKTALEALENGLAAEAQMRGR